MPEKTNINDLYATESLPLAAALSLTFPLESYDNSNPNKGVFYFTREPSLDSYLQQYWSGQLQVPALPYYYQVKNLKNMISPRR